jgi:hypothetical protein
MRRLSRNVYPEVKTTHDCIKIVSFLEDDGRILTFSSVLQEWPSHSSNLIKSNQSCPTQSILATRITHLSLILKNYHCLIEIASCLLSPVREAVSHYVRFHVAPYHHSLLWLQKNHTTCIHRLLTTCIHILHTTCIHRLHTTCIQLAFTDCTQLLHSQIAHNFCIHRLHTTCIHRLHTTSIHSLHAEKCPVNHAVDLCPVL